MTPFCPLSRRSRPLTSQKLQSLRNVLVRSPSLRSSWSPPTSALHGHRSVSTGSSLVKSGGGGASRTKSPVSLPQHSSGNGHGLGVRQPCMQTAGPFPETCWPGPRLLLPVPQGGSEHTAWRLDTEAIHAMKILETPHIWPLRLVFMCNPVNLADSLLSPQDTTTQIRSTF